MPIAIVRKTDRFAQLGIAASKMAIADARFSQETNGLSEAAVVMGSGLGGQNFHEEQIQAFMESGASGVATSTIPRIAPNAVSAYIAIQNKIKGIWREHVYTRKYLRTAFSDQRWEND